MTTAWIHSREEAVVARSRSGQLLRNAQLVRASGTRNSQRSARGAHSLARNDDMQHTIKNKPSLDEVERLALPVVRLADLWKCKSPKLRTLALRNQMGWVAQLPAAMTHSAAATQLPHANCRHAASSLMHVASAPLNHPFPSPRLVGQVDLGGLAPRAQLRGKGLTHALRLVGVDDLGPLAPVVPGEEMRRERAKLSA